MLIGASSSGGMDIARASVAVVGWTRLKSVIESRSRSKGEWFRTGLLTHEPQYRFEVCSGIKGNSLCPVHSSARRRGCDATANVFRGSAAEALRLANRALALNAINADRVACLVRRLRRKHVFRA